MKLCRSASPRKAAGSPRLPRKRLLQGKPVEESKHLRAGDPEATPGAAVLASGEAVVVPPEPVHRSVANLLPDRCLQPYAVLPTAPSTSTSSFPCCTARSGKTAPSRACSNSPTSPYVGAGVLGSAAGMDKDIMKALFRAADLPIVKHVTILRSDWDTDHKKAEKTVDRALKYPVFVKPANLGSSVGISKARSKKELGPAIYEAAKFDRKIVIEQGVGGAKHKAREIEMLGAWQRPPASLSRR